MEKTIKLTTGEHIPYSALLCKLATHLFVETSNQTSTNNWTIYFDDLEDQYNLEKGFITLTVATDIICSLRNLYGEMVADDEIYYFEGDKDSNGEFKEVDRYFDITLYDSYCLGFVQDDQCIEENRED